MRNSTRSTPRNASARPSLKTDATHPFLIVGIGASAGGLEAVTQLLQALPAKPGVALVLVQHLDPTHESAMAVLLSRSTPMPVLEARDNQRIEPNHVYVIPPNKLMVVARRRLRLLPRVKAREIHSPINRFLKSLAEEEGARAIGVILSGSSGSDGTQGLLAIKAGAGVTFAQDEKSAKYPNMPAAAVAAGCVDFVLPPAKIARELARLAGNGYLSAVAETEHPLPVEEKAFADVLGNLRRHMGVDFSQYKHATLRRRVQRRMVLNKIEALPDYAAYLHRHANEVRELYNDILINVTGFFRDPGVFQLLKRKVFPRLLKNRAPEDNLRIWVPGCSTGEEVYSIAMAFVEFLAEKKAHFQVQIFGTDISEPALDKARAAIYPDSIQNEMSAERLRRFFLRSEKGYRVNKSIREMCVFARQNLVTDPPFSSLDLVSCRNVLIYLGPGLQRKIMPLLHYALKPTGYLLLGASESIGAFADLFSFADKKAKIYGKRITHIRPPIARTSPATELRPNVTALPAAPAPSETAPRISDVQKQADRILLAHHTPSGVVINRHLEVLQFRGRTGPYLEHPHGEASLNLLKMAREGLGFSLRAAVARAIKENARVREECVPVRQGGLYREVDFEIVPFQVPPGRERFYLVTFESPSAPAPEKGRAGRGRKAGRAVSVEGAELSRLREELAATRESLEAIIQEQEATNEELRSANEEIMSNNEELETSKEELQSTNEELATLNDELENRNHELDHVNNDLHNLLGSVNIPVVIVGPDLRIRRFTNVAEKTLNLIPTDVGRPLTDLNLNVMVPQLGQMVAEVIDTLQARDVEVQDNGKHWWSLRIRPYRTTDNKIDGAVVALVDIDVLKQGMDRNTQQRAFAESVVNTVRQPLMVLDKDLVVQSINTAFRRIFQVSDEQTLHRRIYELGNGQWDIPRLRTLLEDILPHNSTFHDFEVNHVFPDIGRKKMLLNAQVMMCDDNPARLILLAIEDVTDR
jgi:two-component system CheB/CheR fusion protein